LPSLLRNLKYLFITFVIGLLFVAVGHGAEYFISPTGSDAANGQTAGTPWKTFQYSFNTMSGGDTLWLADGTYSTTTATGYIASNDYPNEVTNSSQPPSGLDISHMTTVKAINEGSVTIEGGLWLGRSAYKRSYIKIQGITFEGGGVLYNTSYNTLKNCGFHVAGQEIDGSILTVGTNDHEQGNTYNLIEDCWVWGQRRAVAINYRADCNVWRRVVIRDDDSSVDTNPCIGFSVYDSSSTSVQNMIVIDRLVTGQAYGDFATAQHTEGNHLNMNNEWLGCISLNSQDNGYHFEADSVGENTYKLLNCIAWGSGINVAQSTENGIVENCTSGNYTGAGIRFYSSGGTMNYGYMRNVISYNAGTYAITSGTAPVNANVYGWGTDKYQVEACTVGELTTDPTNDGTPASLKYIVRIEDGSALKGTGYGGADYGANVVYKYGTDGTRYGDEGYNTLTANSLWPYPNEDRIKTEMAADSARGFCTGTSLGGYSQTLTRYIWEYLGNTIPTTIYGDLPAGSKTFNSGTWRGTY